MNVQAVLFDIDGTLVDSNEQHVAAWEFAFGEVGYPQHADAIRGQIGKGGDLLVPTLMPGADDDMIAQVAELHGNRFKKLFLAHVRPFPRAADLVRAVHRSGRKVVLASSAKRAELDHYVALLDVGDVLAASTSIDDVAASKPAPDIFAAALDRIGVAAARACVVGDTPYDVEAARKAGIAAIGLLSGPFDAVRLKQAGAAAVYADVAALRAGLRGSPLAR